MSNVVKLYPNGSAKNPDLVLEQAIGQFSDVLIIGYDKDGFLDGRATLGLKDGGDLLWLIEGFKQNLLNGAYRGTEE